jgi:hypothetical protein
MAGIGDDIKEVLQELGTTAIITYSNGTTYTEKVDVESFPEHSSEFIRQFFSTLTLSFDTSARNGDSIAFKGLYFLLTNIIESYFEDLVVDNIAALYKCNVNGVMKRPTTVTDVNYVRQITFATVTGNPASIRALQYENKFGMEPLFEADTQFLLKEKHVLIIPAGIDVKVGDRWYPDYTDTSVFFKVNSIETYRLPNTPICTLSEDER